MLEIIKWNELDNISLCVFFVLLRVKWVFIAIKLNHFFKIVIADANNHDWQGKARTFHNRICCLLKVWYGPIGKNKQNVIFLILLRNLFLSAVCFDIIDNFWEICRSRKLNLLKYLHIYFKNAFEAIDFSIFFIIKGKAMASLAIPLCTKAIDWKLLIIIIML